MNTYSLGGGTSVELTQIKNMWSSMAPNLNEKQRRQYAATLAESYGYGGATVVHKVTGVALNTITSGKKDLINSKTNKNEENDTRVRRIGRGPKKMEVYFPDIKELVRSIVDDSTYGDPEKVLSWTTASLRKITAKIASIHNIDVSHTTIGSILEELNYSKQCNKKMLQIGPPHPDRNAQFEFINKTAKQFIEAGDPVISVDTKKKELIGNFKNCGTEYRKKKDPRQVLDHDFLIKKLGKIAPYGVYNLNYNIGYVNLGISHDTAEFAVESISRWWECIGKNTFPKAKKLLITCDCGGSNGNRSRLWKFQLSQFAKRSKLNLYISHFPPGTSKWNKIEHKLFCFISKNWQGKPLIDVQTAIDLIGATTTQTGLKVICHKDDNSYELAIKVSEEEFKSISISAIAPFDNWNYIIYGK
jgi:hypothetical protein